MTVYFAGAGPGDPELIPVKTYRLLKRCPVIMYAGSLVAPEIIAEANDTAKLVDSASLTLEEIVTQLVTAAQTGQDVLRLHSGDPSIYGAVSEQKRHLESLGIHCEIIPGITVAFATAAKLGCGLTVAGGAQSVIFTRYGSKTPMPATEQLAHMAQSRATLAIYLSTAHLHSMVAELTPHYGSDCPAVCAYKVSQPQEHIIRATLATIVAQTRRAGIVRSALIMVGHALANPTDLTSYLYSAEQAHIYRPKYRKC